MIPTKIIIHHSLTRDSDTVSWNPIRQYHLAKGWIGIGYHAGVEMINGHAEILLGRTWSQTGAHTRGENYHSLGLCIVGNFDDEPPRPEILDAAIMVTRLWMRLYNIEADKVYGHNHFANYKSCPGHNFDMNAFRARL